MSQNGWLPGCPFFILYFQAMYSYFQGKTVWVTGASSGIGEALCRLLDKAGARLVLSSRKEAELKRVKNTLSSPEHIVFPIDLSQQADFPGKVQLLLALAGHVDILVNNGGISQRSLALETSVDVDKRLFDVNFFGAAALTKAILPSMLDRGGGHIVVVSSVTGLFGTPYRSAYAASKHALHGFFDSLRAELHDQHVPVTLICPGFIRTQITMNALTGDGSPLAEMDRGTSDGMDVDVFARKMLRAVARRKRQTCIGGPKELFGVYMKRFFPGIFAWLVTRLSVR